MLLTSLVVFPVYAIARRYLDMRKSLLLGGLVLLLPFQFTMPAYIMSENLFLPLVMMALSVISRPFANSRTAVAGQILLGGILCGMVFLTRYQGLAAVGAFALYLVFKCFYFERGTIGRLFPVAARLGLVALFVAVFLASVAVWLIADTPGRQGMMVRVASFLTYPKGTKEFRGAQFVQWVVWYLAYMLLALAPFVLPLLVRAKNLVGDALRKEHGGLFCLCFLLCGALGFLAVRHSYSADYNRPTAGYILGRYIACVIPILAVCLFIAMFSGRGRPVKKRTWGIAVFPAVALLVLAYFTLLGKLGMAKKINYRMGFVSDINAPDVMVYRVYGMAALVAGIVAIVLVGLVYVLNARKPMPLLAAILLGYYAAADTGILASRIQAADTPAITFAVYRQLDTEAMVIAVVNASNMDSTTLPARLYFWDMRGVQFAVEPYWQGAVTFDDRAAYVLSAVPYYGAEETGLHFYKLPLDKGRLTEEGLAEAAAYVLPMDAE